MGKNKKPKKAVEAETIQKDIIELLIDSLINNPATNIDFIPDDLERQIYDIILHNIEGAVICCPFCFQKK